MLANRFGEHSRLRPWPPGMQRRIARFDGRVRSGAAHKKTAGARRKAPAGLVHGDSDLSAGPSRKKWLHSQLLTFYDVVRPGKVASRGKFQERRQRDGAPAAVEESAPPALSLIHPWRGGWRWRYWR